VGDASQSERKVLDRQRAEMLKLPGKVKSKEVETLQQQLRAAQEEARGAEARHTATAAVAQARAGELLRQVEELSAQNQRLLDKQAKLTHANEVLKQQQLQAEVHANELTRRNDELTRASLALADAAAASAQPTATPPPPRGAVGGSGGRNVMGGSGVLLSPPPTQMLPSPASSTASSSRGGSIMPGLVVRSPAADGGGGGGAGAIDTSGGLRTVVVHGDGDAAEAAHQSALQRLVEAVRQGNQVRGGRWPLLARRRRRRPQAKSALNPQPNPDMIPRLQVLADPPRSPPVESAAGGVSEPASAGSPAARPPTHTADTTATVWVARPSFPSFLHADSHATPPSPVREVRVRACVMK